MTHGKTADETALWRGHVASARLATWVGFIGAVAFLFAVMLLCFQAASLEFQAASVMIPGALAVAGASMMWGGRLLASRTEALLTPRPRLRLVSDYRIEDRRTAA